MFLATWLTTLGKTHIEDLGESFKVYFYWLITHCKTSCKKVELDSTKHDDCCNKNVVGLDDCIMLHHAISHATCVATKS